MKKKIALLLAAVMAVTAFPMTALAASDNTITRKASVSGDGKLLIEEREGLGVSGSDWGRIGYLKVSFKDNIAKGETFKLALEGAKFNFKDNLSATSSTTRTKDLSDIRGAVVASVTEPTATDTRAEALAYAKNLATAVDTNLNKNDDGDLYTTIGAVVKVTYTYVDNTVPATPVDVTETISSADAALTGTATFKIKTIDDVTVTYNVFSALTDLPVAATYDTAKGKLTGNMYERTAAGENLYTMEIGYGDATTAVVTLNAAITTPGYILIPIVVELVGDRDDYRIRVIDEGNSPVTGNSLAFAESVSGKTKTSVEDTVTARSEFELKIIRIAEQKLGTIKAENSFRLEAPRGYEFSNPNAAGSKFEIGVDAGLYHASTSAAGKFPSGNATVNFYKGRNDENDRSILEFTVKGLTPSDRTRGSIYIKGLVLIAENEEDITAGDVNLTIKNMGSKTTFTEESFKVATATDYTVTLARTKDAIPELVSGRYNDKIDKAATGPAKTAPGIESQAARVKFSEKIANAWWATGTTKLVLPENVTVIKAEFREVKNMESGLAAGIQYNSHTREGRVTVKDNEITISNVKVVKDKKASFELDLWLSIAPTFEGDITLALAGSGVTKVVDSEKLPSVVIAKAIKPVEVKVDKVSEVQVGYQYFTVSDFSITETKAGNLIKGQEVLVSITDGISIDMEIAKGFTAKVSAGDLKISNVTTSSVLSTRVGASTKTEGQIKFEIDRESKEASTISFSNVQVKVSRNVPYSNLSVSEDRGIDLVVWGNAIASNYYQLEENSKVNENDLFTVPGISAKYINVVTVANDAGSEFKNTVKVTIGNPVIKVNNADVTMPVAAYVSTASNSTMVPVRFVANALGLADNAVKWDNAARTVTVDAGTRIVQFQIGNTNYLVNGVSVPMVSPDGLPVAAEITSERAFIPFRALGEAFNVTVGWDAATSTATYNAAEAK